MWMLNNTTGNAYALTTLSPIRNGYTPDEIAYADVVKDRLQEWNFAPNSPMALVPQTYLCRYFVLDDVYTQSLPGFNAVQENPLSDAVNLLDDSFRHAVMPKEDHLKSRYLVFSCDFHCGPGGKPDNYLRGMWDAISASIKEVWPYCYGFEDVDNADKFIAYMKKCQLEAALFFVGSNDAPLEEQLKALYLKQQLSQFAVDNQGLDAEKLRFNFQKFIERVEPANLAGPSWTPGQYRLQQG